MKKIVKTYALFEGRPGHNLPANDGALCLDFDFATKKVVKSKKWQEALTLAKNSEVPVEVRVIITGLTPATTEFLAAFVDCYTFKSWDWYMKPEYDQKPVSLILMHWDKYTNTYWEQQVF
jgi:hypothetical protein